MRVSFVRARPATSPLRRHLFVSASLAFMLLTSPVSAQTDPVITGEPPAASPAPTSPPTAGQPTPPPSSDAPASRAPRPQAPPGTPLTDGTETTKAERLGTLFADLRKAATHQAAATTAAKIEAEWADSGSATVDLMLVWAAEAMSKNNPAAALDFIDQAMILRPDFPEIWNRRATLNYVASDFGKSLVDIEKTLSLEPRHFGALMGLGMILEETDRKTEALETYMRVLEVYPANKGAQDAVGRLSEELSGQPI